MKILLVQTSFLGDVILSTPVIAGIKKIYPQSEVWCMTTPLAAPLLQRDPLISGIVELDKHGKHRGILGSRKIIAQLREMRFDKAYSLHRSARTALLLYFAQIPERIGFSSAKLSFLYTRTVKRLKGVHDVVRNLSLLTKDASLDLLDSSLRVFAPQENEISAEISTLRGAVILVPGSSWRTKMWRAEGYSDLASFFLSKGLEVILTGNSKERLLCDKVGAGMAVKNLAGRISLDEMLFLVKHSKLLVCNDSMALHLASAFKIPNVAIFCATSPQFGFGPWENNGIVVEKEGLRCKPCSPHGSARCPTGTWACMNELDSYRALEAARSLLGY